MHWLDLLFPPRPDEIGIRDLSHDDFLALVAPRLVPETRPGTVALLPFGNPRVRSAIHEAKYHGSKYSFQLLGSALAEYLRDADDYDYGFLRFDLENSGLRSNFVLVPVPLGEKRRKERGYNQIEEVAVRALRAMRKEVTGMLTLDSDLLIRARETISQVSLPRHKREENMRDAFKATRRADSTHTYIVIDDVITTGATLQSAVNALRDAGATKIIPLALAH